MSALRVKKAEKKHLLLGIKFKNREKIAQAIRTIRQLQRKCPGWDSVEEIRRWRQL